MPKKQIFYDLKLLNQCIQRDNPKSVEIPEKLNREVKIIYVCVCGKDGEANFRAIYKNGGMKCKECKKINANIKSQQTNMKIRGVTHPLKDIRIQEKITKTNNQRRGVDRPAQDRNVREKMENTNLSKHGVKYTLSSKEVREKGKQTLIKKFGVSHPAQSDIIKEKMENTNLSRYGVKYTLSSKEVREKGKQTIIKKFGVDNVSQSNIIKEMKKETSQLNYGTDYPSQSNIIKEMKKETSRLNYGTDYPMQNSEYYKYMSKKVFNRKSYLFPSGRKDIVQGYEPYALDILIKKYKEEDIITGSSNVPEIWYDFENEKKRYYTDIYIPSENLCIEVKSTYTYESSYEQNQAKMKGTMDAGYNFVFWIFDEKGNLVE
jgi:hypothetical protein